MSFRDLIDTATAIALADKLHPTEEAVWARYCREFSIRFSTPLVEVRAMDPLFVITEVNAENLSDFNPEEQLDALLDMLGSLQDPNYDAKREQSIREELRELAEQDQLRREEGRAIHPSLEKDKRVIVKEEHKPTELPKAGGLNMEAIRRLNNQDSEG